MKKKRVLLVSCSVILLCICIVAGMSYALFTDSASVSNHLKAGNLDVTLTRTNLEYSVLNNNGELEVSRVTGAQSFTGSNTNNIFGISSEDMVIVPGSYFDAQLQIGNGGNVAFNYTVQLTDISNTKLAEQLRVTVTKPDGTTETKMLKEFSGAIFTGVMQKGTTAQTFSVKVEFLDDSNENFTNNDAMSGVADFDLVVTATQKTA